LQEYPVFGVSLWQSSSSSFWVWKGIGSHLGFEQYQSDCKPTVGFTVGRLCVFREALTGDPTPEWTEVWAHINLGKIFDITGECERAVNEFDLALYTDDDAFDPQREV
jgi:hypothetical protein